MPLFNRQVFLQIGPPGQEGRELRDLRVIFSVTMSPEATPNKAIIRVYNTSPSAVALLQETGVIVRLLAGYDVPRLIFEGSPVKGGVVMVKNGPDRILTIEGQDGGRTYRVSRLEVSFATETTLEQVFNVAVAQLGLPKGHILSPFPEHRFTNGIHLSGKTSDVMDRIALMAEADWYIRDGAIFLVAKDSDTGEPVVEFSAALGNLIGSPQPKEKGIEVRALLEASIRPGRKASVKSRDFDGIYKVGDVAFTGDTHGNDWYVVFTGTEI